MLISSADILALAADFKTPGFWGGLILTILTAPSDVVAQLYNFMPEHELIHIENSTIKKVLSYYLAIGCACGGMTIYGNTVERAFYQLGKTARPLSQTSSLLSSLLQHQAYDLILAHRFALLLVYLMNYYRGN